MEEADCVNTQAEHAGRVYVKLAALLGIQTPSVLGAMLPNAHVEFHSSLVQGVKGSVNVLMVAAKTPSR
jgi:hypothetical protein